MAAFLILVEKVDIYFPTESAKKQNISKHFTTRLPDFLKVSLFPVKSFLKTSLSTPTTDKFKFWKVFEAGCAYAESKTVQRMA